MYDSSLSLIIGFHGCEESVKQKLLNSSGSAVHSYPPEKLIARISLQTLVIFI